jgi:hypothetical protein
MSRGPKQIPHGDKWRKADASRRPWVYVGRVYQRRRRLLQPFERLQRLLGRLNAAHLGHKRLGGKQRFNTQDVIACGGWRFCRGTRPHIRNGSREERKAEDRAALVRRWNAGRPGSVEGRTSTRRRRV